MRNACMFKTLYTANRSRQGGSHHRPCLVLYLGYDHWEQTQRVLGIQLGLLLHLLHLLHFLHLLHLLRRLLDLLFGLFLL